MTNTTNTTNTTATPEQSGIMLPLTPTEFGVVVALAGIGISFMTENRETLDSYREILTSADTEAAAFTAFEKLVQALDRVTADRQGAA